MLRDPAAFTGTAELFRTLRASGETWTFGLDPVSLADFLRARDLQLLEDLGAAEYRALCFGPRSREMRGYEFYRIALAGVAA